MPSMSCWIPSTIASSVCATDATIIACVASGRSAAPVSPMSHAESTLVSRRAASALTSAGPCVLSWAFGPSSMMGTRTLGPKLDSASCSARAVWLPGTTTIVGESEWLTPSPIAARIAATVNQAAKATKGRRVEKRARCSMETTLRCWMSNCLDAMRGGP